MLIMNSYASSGCSTSEVVRAFVQTKAVCGCEVQLQVSLCVFVCVDPKLRNLVSNCSVD